jgi:predicted nucleotidyltransferase
MSDKQERPPIEALPSDVRARIVEWTKTLEEALGEHLVGILVHGSVARGEYRPGESDVDAVIVLKDASFATLDAIANAMQLARYSARIEAMILTEDEITGASDVFPLLYDDIKRCHFLLAGRDPFTAVVVHDTHRRLRIEQELREARIRMRRAVTDAAGAREALGGAVVRKLRQVRGPFHALLKLKGIVTAPDLPTVLTKICEAYGVDPAPLRAARESPEAAYAAFTTLLDKAVHEVNAMEDAKEVQR